MDQERERDEFRRMEIVAKREQSARLIADYREKIDFFRSRIDWCNKMLGRIEQRLGEPDNDEEPRWN
jgi:hypothetical protein